MLKIVFEDERLIVVDKPCGMLTMSAGRQGEVTAYSLLYDYMSGKRSRFGHDIYIVHRLDRDTSGLLVFAKDFETKIRMQENWNQCVKERKYTAVLEGRIEDEEGWIETWLYENPKSLMVHCYELREGDSPQNPPRKDWQFAATRCRTVKRGEIAGKPYTIVEFDLETGRKNQIRVHSQWIGHPIAGDRKYGAQTNPFGRLALHAQGLSFIHPWTGRTKKFRSKTPQKFKI